MQLSWREFSRGKADRADVKEFSQRLEYNLFRLHYELLSGDYRHSHYTSFIIADPKLRHIHKARVKDRIVHHAINRILSPIYESSFIFDSYSSRRGKGSHRAICRLRNFAWKLSCNNTSDIWFLKGDIRKYFASVNQAILIDILSRKIKDYKTAKLLEEIIFSFADNPGRGIPLGNLTSQLFANVYLDPFDQYVKRQLKVKYYVRYADDFIIVAKDKEYLHDLIPILSNFLASELDLDLHPDKISLRPWHRGIDFLGYVIFPYHTILRPKTKRRMLKRANKNNLASYLGLLCHCRGYQLKNKIAKIAEFC